MKSGIISLFLLVVAAMTVTAMRPALAQSCSLTAQDINFGTIDFFGTGSTAQAHFTIDCEVEPHKDVLVCARLGDGSSSYEGLSRLLLSGSNRLRYQLYKDIERRNVWGGAGISSGGTQHQFRIPAAAVAGPVSLVVPVYGAVETRQRGKPPGHYESHFNTAFVDFRYGYATSPSDGCLFPPGQSTSASFTVSGQVVKTCSVFTSAVDFGVVDVVHNFKDAVGSIHVECSPPDTGYEISLGKGLNPDGAGKRRMAHQSGRLYYELYQDQNRQKPWGSTSHLDTVKGVYQLAPARHDVFGRVPRQSLPRSGSYSDLVLVTVTY